MKESCASFKCAHTLAHSFIASGTVVAALGARGLRVVGFWSNATGESNTFHDPIELRVVRRL